MPKFPTYPSNLEEAVKTLRKNDQILRRIIERIGPCKIKLEKNTFHILARSIVFQQLSIYAAGTIFNRLMLLYDHSPFLLPEDILNSSLEELRSCGISRPKSRYLKDLAQKFQENVITPEKFSRMSNEEITEQLMRVKGIGRWTSEIFLIFSLGRLDVLPVDDVGFQRAVKINYKLRLPITPQKIQKIALKWGKYASIATWYLWSSLEDSKM
jgi:DNA-3-methyladenine glycosylase II